MRSELFEIRSLFVNSHLRSESEFARSESEFELRSETYDFRSEVWIRSESDFGGLRTQTSDLRSEVPGLNSEV